MITIESSMNPRYRGWLSLLEASGIRAERRALLSGRKIIDELLGQDPARICEILLPPGTAPIHDDVRHVRLSSDLFKSLDVIGTKAPLAVIDAPALATWTPAGPRGLELVLALSDPGNLGACLRSAEAFGARRVILTEECCSPYLPRALRASTGSSLRLEIVRTGPLAAFGGKTLVALDGRGEPLSAFAWPDDVYLVLGEVGRGVPTTLGARMISIPMRGKVESLNATVAASLALFAHASRTASSISTKGNI